MASERVHIHMEEYSHGSVRDQDPDYQKPLGSPYGAAVSVSDFADAFWERHLELRNRGRAATLRRRARMDGDDSDRDRLRRDGRRMTYRDELMQQISLEMTKRNALRRQDVVAGQDRNMMGLSELNHTNSEFWDAEGCTGEFREVVSRLSGGRQTMGIGEGPVDLPPGYERGPRYTNPDRSDYREAPVNRGSSPLGMVWRSGGSWGVSDALRLIGYRPDRPCCEKSAEAMHNAGAAAHWANGRVFG